MSGARWQPPLVSPIEPNGHRWTDWLFSFFWLRLAFFLSVVHERIPGLFANGRHPLEYMDDHAFFSFDASNTLTVQRYHQLPAWNPYWCGGTVGIAGPEDNFFGADILLRLLFDVGIARHMLAIVGLLLAAEGTYRLARSMGSSGLASTGAALIYMINSTVYPLWLGNGFLNFVLGFGLLPWVLWCFIQGIERPGYRYLGGFFFAWIFVHAGTYPAPYTLLTIGFLTISLAILMRNEGERAWAKPFVSAIVLGAVFLVLAQAKFLPLVMFLKQFSRTWLPIEQLPAGTILGVFSAAHVPLLILAGLAPLTRDRWAVVCALGAGLFFVVSMGDFDPLSPYHLLKQLPLFKQLRTPERHVILVLLFLACGAARFVTVLEDTVARFVSWLFGVDSVGELPAPIRVTSVLAGTLAVALAIGPRYTQMLKDATTQFASVAFTFEPPRHMGGEFRQHRGNRRDGHIFPAINAGSIACITGIPVTQSRLLRGDLAQEEYPLDPALATVRRVRWTPNEIELDVQARRATRVLINQNHHKYWRSSVGAVVSHQGLLAIDVPAGRHRVRLRYVDRPMQIGIAISLLGLAWLSVVAAAYARRRWRKLRATFASPASPSGGKPPLVAVAVAEEPKEPEEPPSPTDVASGPDQVSAVDDADVAVIDEPRIESAGSPAAEQGETIVASRDEEADSESIAVEPPRSPSAETPSGETTPPATPPREDHDE